MDTSAKLDPARCSICGRPNNCAMADGRPAADCWCYSATITDEMMKRVPAEARGVVCICARCASHTQGDA